MDNDVCVWEKRFVYYTVGKDEAYRVSCTSGKDFLEKDDSWIYCPWCGKKIEVNE